MQLLRLVSLTFLKRCVKEYYCCLVSNVEKLRKQLESGSKGHTDAYVGFDSKLLNGYVILYIDVLKLTKYT